MAGMKVMVMVMVIVENVRNDMKYFLTECFYDLGHELHGNTYIIL